MKNNKKNKIPTQILIHNKEIIQNKRIIMILLNLALNAIKNKGLKVGVYMDGNGTRKQRLEVLNVVVAIVMVILNILISLVTQQQKKNAMLLVVITDG
jgi:hypothetical protein